MKNSKFKIIGVSFLMLLFISLNSFAQEENTDREKGKSNHHMEKRQAMKKKGSHIPNLTDEQKEQLKVVKIKLQRETLPLKNELREKKARLQTLTSTEGSSKKDINKVIDEIGTLQTKMMKVEVNNQLEIKKFLTEEQRLFLDSHQHMKKPRHNKMKG